MTVFMSTAFAIGGPIPRINTAAPDSRSSRAPTPGVDNFAILGWVCRFDHVERVTEEGAENSSNCTCSHEFCSHTPLAHRRAIESHAVMRRTD